jgi:hypothetical protein
MDAKSSKTPDITAMLTIAEEVATTAPATLPTLNTEAAGPKPAKIVTRTLRLWKDGTDWKAVWDGEKPQWTFEPTPTLVQHLTKETYAIPTTQPATEPAKK